MTSLLSGHYTVLVDDNIRKESTHKRVRKIINRYDFRRYQIYHSSCSDFNSRVRRVSSRETFRRMLLGWPGVYIIFSAFIYILSKLSKSHLLCAFIATAGGKVREFVRSYYCFAHDVKLRFARWYRDLCASFEFPCIIHANLLPCPHALVDRQHVSLKYKVAQ